MRISLLLLLVSLSALQGQTKPSYSKQVQPFFTRYCVECHNAKETEGGLNLESYKTLTAGGDHGEAVVAGKPDTSRLVRMIEKKLRPTMPPKRSKQPPPGEIALVRAWVLDGARDDSAGSRIVLPTIRPRKKPATPVTAVAYRPDGKLLAASGRGVVALINPATGEVVSQLSAVRDRVTSLAFSPKGDLLAAAASTVGEGHEVRLWQSASNGKFQGLGSIVSKHDDVIQAMTFSPDGTLLATASYDRLIRLHDVKSRAEPRVLRDHSDSVYGLSFHPEGKILASAGADRAVKVWDVATGNRLYTLGESTDWVYSVVWSPDGKRLAGAGVDRSIRVWEADRAGGKIVNSVFAHEAGILRLEYARDGKTIYSLGEDRILKAWDPVKMVERKVYPKLPEAPLSMALSPLQNELAVGLYDGSLRLLDAGSGAVRKQPLPIKPQVPVLEKVTPDTLVRGKKTTVTLIGKHLRETDIQVSVPGTKVTVTASDATQVKADIELPESAPLGRVTVKVRNEAGESKPQTLIVDRFAALNEVEPNDSPRTGQMIDLSVTIVGAANKAGDADWYRFAAKAGQEIGVHAVIGPIGSKLNPILKLVDPAGNTVAETLSDHLGHVCKQTGVYSVGIRDGDYRGGADMTYRLSIGAVPVVTSIFPTGVMKGARATIQIEGVHLGKQKSLTVEAPATTAIGSSIPVPFVIGEGKPLGLPNLVVGEFPEVVPGKDMALPIPGIANGQISRPGETQTWRFNAKKGQRLILEVNAARMKSPLDSTMDILDSTGRPLPRVTLRSLARTYTVFRDNDSRTNGIRIEAWSELSVNDYILVGSEVIKILALPRNPDDDCRFFTEQGQRLGYFGTTPMFKSLGSPMYKVSVHPPGTTFPPNGLPVVTLFWRNDDGGPGMNKDSQLVFDVPADGVYQVRIGDARGEGSSAHTYRLTVRPPRPDYTVSMSLPGEVSKGGAVPVQINVSRKDEFDGPINLELSGLPKGYHAPATNIPAGEDSTSVSLFAEPGAPALKQRPTLTLTAKASIEGKEVIRQATGTLPRLIEPGDIVTTTEQQDVTIQRGGETRITVNVERRNGFKGRIPLDVQGLPHGVRVLDVGLNGILITPTEKKRTFVLYCEPWVKPVEHPIVVLARREGKKGEHAARSVLLRVK